jgi:hypothetical protein
MRNLLIALSISCVIGSPLASAAGNQTADEARTHFVRGLAAVEMAKSDHELADAIAEFKKAIDMDPQMPAAWYNLAMVQVKVGHLTEAIENYRHYLAIVPKADDAQRVKDEIIKLEYRLEKLGRFQALSGRWISPNGTVAMVETAKDRLRITFKGPLHFTDSAEVYIRKVLNDPPTTYEYGNASFDLELKGASLEGVFEFSDSSHTDKECILPTEKNPVMGTLNDGHMTLKFTKGKYKVVMDYEKALFQKTVVFCQSIIPIRSLTKELVLNGPLGDGGLNAQLSKTDQGTYALKTNANSAAGLEEGDEVVAVDGTSVASLEIGDVILKMSGKPGSTVQLTIARKKGAESVTQRIDVQRVEVTRPR